MRTTIHNLIEAKKAEREEDGEAGFSLIELIIVVVIIGILAAIAIPIFANIQKNAHDADAQSAASNGATTAAIIMSQSGKTATDVKDDPAFTKLVKGSVSAIALTTPATGTDLAQVCVTVTYNGGNYSTWATGPGCTAPGGAGAGN